MPARFEQLDGRFCNTLLAWFRAGKRELPWRENRDPYRIWVSEIMLQQTRVEAVRGYYERFLKAFPTVEDLANCEEEKLLKLWEGLGYYSRARNLHLAAREIVTVYGGQFPRSIVLLKKLPGIGAYTAGAIASIAFGEPEPAVDGNVLRVVARVCGIAADMTDVSIRQEVAEALRKIYPPQECGDFTESLMELGALICIPHGMPKCDNCPVRSGCIAYAENRIAELPVKKTKIPKKIEQRTLLLYVCGEKILLHRRPGKGLLAGLWEIPGVDGLLQETQINALVANRGETVVTITKLREAKHVFTHKIWEMAAWRIEVMQAFSPTEQEVWVTFDEIEKKYPLPSAFDAYRDEMRAIGR